MGVNQINIQISTEAVTFSLSLITKGTFLSVVKVGFPPFEAAPVSDKIRALYPVWNKVVTQPAFGMVLCNVGGATINNVTTPVIIELIHLNVVTDSEQFPERTN